MNERTKNILLTIALSIVIIPAILAPAIFILSLETAFMTSP